MACVAATLALVAAACGTSSRPNSTDASAPRGGLTNGKLKAAARGVTADTIKIAFTYPDLESLAKSGFVKVSDGSYPDVIKALVDDINANGGIDGRKLEVFPEKYSVFGTSGMLATCTKVTEDENVFMVLGGFVANSANLCVAREHATPMLSLFGSGFNGVVLAQARAPWATPNASDERAIKALVLALTRQRSLAGKTIGLYGGGESSKPLVDLTESTLKSAGYSVKASAINDATDIEAIDSQDKVIGTKFKDERIDVVFVLFAPPPGTNFDAVGFHPAMYSPQTALISAGALTNPYEKFSIVAGLGASSDPDGGYNSAVMRRCRTIWTKATGKEIKTPPEERRAGKSSNFFAMSNACTALRIFVDAAKAAGPNLTPATWQHGLESLGTIQAAGGFTISFAANKPDGQDSFQLQKFNPAGKANSEIAPFLRIGDPITLMR
jgi:hypothetical protein